jgi:hypothetical protein
MKIKKGFILRKVCGENVIVGEGLEAVNFGKLLALNEPTAWLWSEAQKMESFTTEELAARLSDEYDVSPQQALQDVSSMLEKWKELGVVE